MVESPPAELAEEETSPRRLIIVVVTPGEDPVIESDPPESFATWEMVAAMTRAVEIIEEDEILEKLSVDDEEDSNGSAT